MTTYEATAAGPGQQAAFHHPALFYGTEDEYLDGVGTFIQDAMDHEHAVLVAVPSPQLALLQSHVTGRNKHATWVDMYQAGRNPGRILSMLQEFADHAADDARTGVSIVGEPIWVGRTPAEAWEATRHEALINLAFTGRPVSILCPYDTALPQDVLAQAHRTHPVVGEANGYRASSRYCDPHEVARDCDVALPEPPPQAVVVPFDEQGMAWARDESDRWAAAAGLSQERRTDWLLAVGEALSNSVRHGGGRGTLRMWCVGGEVVAEIRDQGLLANPLTGRRRPDPRAATGGRGVWMMHQLCDLVEIRAAAPGLVLRLHMGLE